ncbi:hypothetical protein OU798_21530 [Prolixibacteraceae bacterium Z1-6]|uniref:PKD domain-containing protein n=1 Tax=Draconibacterium aestuarii TaxID=2998507 RepID=A0A9X3F9B3_9BACT|nr:hypothetical protein [Prolixibacteraceae bacterium Z1-6]
MKKSIIYSLILATAVLFACDPIENRDSNSLPITADDLVVSATPIVVDGVNSNKIVLKNESPVLSQWYYGLGTTLKSVDTVLMVVTGVSNIVFTGLNPDGTYLIREIPVTVDELVFPVPPEWGLLCGDGAKNWVWDETAGNVFGNGGYLGCNAPCWWGVDKAGMDTEDPDFGSNAYMEFSLDGASLTISNESGSNQEVGKFDFDMDDVTEADGAIWAKGKLNTNNVTILHGWDVNNGNEPFYEYDILELTEDKLQLSAHQPGQGSWGEAWFFMFRAE